MIDSSKDILYIVISFCIIWTTVFLCWMFYYAGKILKNTNQIIEEFRVRLQALSEAVSYIQEKIEGISLVMSTVMKGAGSAVTDIIKSKAKNWMNKKSEDFNRSAKEAVDRAVDVTAAKMKKAAKNIKK